MAHKYENGQWIYTPDESVPTNRPTKTNIGTDTQVTPLPVVKTDNLPTTETKRKADKNFKKSEQNILSGDANVIPNPEYRAKKTIKLMGINILNGLYYIEKVTHTFSKDSGYSQTLSLSKNGIGDSIKKGAVSQPTPESPRPIASSTRPQESKITEVTIRQPVSPPSPVSSSSSTTYTVVSGDNLSAISRRFYGTANRWKDIYNANTNIISNPNLIYPGQVLRIP